MTTKLYFVVYQNSKNEWEFALDSQRRPTMYRSIEQLKKYLYKYKDEKYRVVEYKLNSTPIRIVENALDGIETKILIERKKKENDNGKKHNN